jgi:hypothetical protein
MDKIVIAISNTGKTPASKDQKEQVYKSAVEQFVNAPKKEIDVDTIKKILKAIATLLEAKENDNALNDFNLDTESNFYEQTQPKKLSNHLFE